MEVWKDVEDYEGLYQVSSLGNVKGLDRLVMNSRGNGLRTVRGKFLSKGFGNSGYLQCTLSKHGKQLSVMVHTLVAVAFLNHKREGRKSKIVVDHINNIKTDNRAENLQITTSRHNTSKDQKIKTSKYIGVSFGYKKWDAHIRVDEKQIKIGSFDNELEAANAYQYALIQVKKGTPEKIKIKRAIFSSNYKGVSWCKTHKTWKAGIRIKGVRINLGSFKKENEAAKAYQKALKEKNNG